MNKSEHKFLPFLLVILALSLYVFFVALNNQKQQPQPEVMVPKTTGSLNLTVDQKRVPVGKSFTAQVVADSQKKDIVGFDVLIKYDHDALNLTSVTSPQTGYQVSKTEREGHLSVTATQPLQNNNRTVFENTAVLTLTFTPKVKGATTITILPSVGQEKTKLVTAETTEILTPATSSVGVEIF